MHPIVKKMWAVETNAREWAAKYGFNYSTARAVIFGYRGHKVGKGKKIWDALIKDGFV